MALTDTVCRQSKATDKPRKLSDGGGLYLLVNSTGKYWRWDYRNLGKRKTLALGIYPETSLSEARERHQNARKLLADAAEQKKIDRRAAKLAASNSFEAVALAWLEERGQTVEEAQNTKNIGPSHKRRPAVAR